MEEKVRNFIYLDTKRYISLSFLKAFYWKVLIIPIIMIVMGIAGKSLFPLVSIAVWSLLWWIFVLILQSKRVKKTFELRFLVNGILGLFVSSLFCILYIAINLVSDAPFAELNFFLWILLFYLLFTAIYMAVIILFVHKGIYSKIKEKSQSKTALMLTGIFSGLLPGAGISGMYSARFLRAHASMDIRYTVAAVGFVLLIFLIGLANVNFVQYYYCKKYGITCDEDGNETSPELERRPKAPKCRARKMKKVKKKRPLAVRILIGIVCAVAAIFLALFIIGFIRSI